MVMKKNHAQRAGGNTQSQGIPNPSCLKFAVHPLIPPLYPAAD
jgi:hypothetical protein